MKLANDTAFGLGSLRVHHRSRAGNASRRSDRRRMVYINVVAADGVELPFGGVKRSGFGRELSKYGIEIHQQEADPNRLGKGGHDRTIELFGVDRLLDEDERDIAATCAEIRRYQSATQHRRLV